MSSSRRAMISSRCPVCGHHAAAPFYDGGEQTLATLAWPQSQGEAEALPRHKLQFVQCPQCTHVYNRAFDYAAIPYESKPNRMYNAGTIWRGHLGQTRDLVLTRLPSDPTVVEIGFGDGHFLCGLAEARPGRYIGFDPNGAPRSHPLVEFRQRMFEPLRDGVQLAPDAILVRHVLEHLTEPAALIEQLAWAVSGGKKRCWLFAEVPCIDRVFETGRLADFFFEHYSHFTTESFSTLLDRGGRIDELATGYDGEVVYAIVELAVPPQRLANAAGAIAFHAASASARATISDQLAALASAGRRVAIWGGTGKGAAFIHAFGADAKRFPLVVDSDREKSGTFVPGSGQRIQFRDAMKETPPDVVIIPTQWRARDIVAEMERESIRAKQVLIEHEGRLVDFHGDPHPYR